LLKYTRQEWHGMTFNVASSKANTAFAFLASQLDQAWRKIQLRIKFSIDWSLSLKSVDGKALLLN